MSERDGIEIRAYDPAGDAAAVRACFVELQDHERALEPRAPAGESIADEYLGWMFERCAGHDGRVLVARAGNEVVGFVTVLLAMPRTDPDDPVSAHAMVSELVVREPWRSSGVGARLIAAAETLARAAGRSEIRVSVFGKNHGARRFYAREGYAELMVYLGKPLG